MFQCWDVQVEVEIRNTQDSSTQTEDDNQIVLL